MRISVLCPSSETKLFFLNSGGMSSVRCLKTSLLINIGCGLRLGDQTMDQLPRSCAKPDKNTNYTLKNACFRAILFHQRPCMVPSLTWRLRLLRQNFTQQTQAECSVEAVATMIGCLPTQALAFLAVFVYATHVTQAIAFEWKPGFSRPYTLQPLLSLPRYLLHTAWQLKLEL